jgi:alkyl sulfatase BDS1-like metallo-beta-lactamase superfamily hydrolase
LPDHCDDDYLTAERYGVAEHHVRQIRGGLFGFFDGDPANLFPLAPVEHAQRMIDGFGGVDEVRRQAEAAIDGDDLRWAIELSSWLERVGADRTLLARSLRLVAQRTPAANIRNWCLTRALELDGTLDNSRLNRHRFSARQVLAAPIEQSVHVLRVLLDPELADGLNLRLAWQFADGTRTGLHVRNSVAAPFDGAEADATIHCDARTWAAMVSSTVAVSAAMDAGDLQLTGDAAGALRALACFDVDGLRG